MSEKQQDHDRNGKFTEGNQVAAKNKLVANLLSRAYKQEDGKRARMMVEKIWDLAAEGERWAVEFVRDTLDGKPKQDTTVSNPDGSNLFDAIAVSLVNAQRRDT